MSINSEIKSLEELIEELTFQSTTLLKKLNDTELEKFNSVLNSVIVALNKNASISSKKDLEELSRNLINFNKSLKNVSHGIASASFKEFNLSIERLDKINLTSSNLLDRAIKIYDKQSLSKNVIVQHYKKTHDAFISFQDEIERYTEKSNMILKLNNIDYVELRKQMKAEINSVFSENIQELVKNNKLAKKLTEENLLSIKKHNQSIKSINIKALVSTLIISFVLGILTITTFQVDILKNKILDNKIKNLEQIKVLKKDLKEEKNNVAQKYKLSKNVQKLLENNVQIIEEKNQKFVVVSKENVKKIYISDAGYGVILLK